MGWILLIAYMMAMIGAVAYLWAAGRIDIDLGPIASSLMMMGVAGLVIWSYLVTNIFPKPPEPTPAPTPAPVIAAATPAPEPVTPPPEPTPELTPAPPSSDAILEIEEADGTGMELGALPETPSADGTLLAGATVYFPLNSTMLVCEARKQIDEVSRFVKTHEIVAIQLEGHTDRAGETVRNYSLSYARAEAVYRYLVYVEDIPASLFDPIISRGEEAPAEETGDGVRDPLNRRVGIVVEYIPYEDELGGIRSVWFKPGLTRCPNSLNLPAQSP